MDAQAAAPADDQQAAPQGYEICIAVLADGSFRVTSEPLDADDSGESEGGKEAGSIGEALKIALELFRDGAPSNEDDEFQSGFGTPEKPNGLTTMPKGGYAED